MYWQHLVADFPGLARAVVERLSLNKVAKALSHNKSSIGDWLRGASPSKAEDVGGVLRLALKNGIEIERFQTFAPIYDFSPMLSYEEKVEKDPPELNWLVKIQLPPERKATFCGKDFQSPLGVASSPLLGDDRWAKLMLDLSFVGPSTFKTRRTGWKTSWDPPQIAFVLEPPDLRIYDPDLPPEVLVTFKRNETEDSVLNLVNSIGVPSEKTATLWQETYQRIKLLDGGDCVGLSVMAEGDARQDFIKDIQLVAHKAAEVLPIFVEYNPSCPNLEKDNDLWTDLALLKKVCAEIASILSPRGIPLVIKLPYLRGNRLKEVLKAIGKHVSGISFHNTIRVRPVVRNQRDNKLYPAFQSRAFGGLSGPCTFAVGLEGLNELVQFKEELGFDFDIAALGGATTKSDVVQFLNAGADIVQVCTAAMFDPLLAWKTRYHFKASDLGFTPQQASALLSARNQSEIESQKNAFEAQGQIQRRSPHQAVPWEKFVSVWNQWMEQQPPTLPSRPLRLPAPKSISQWIREFTDEKNK